MQQNSTLFDNTKSSAMAFIGKPIPWPDGFLSTDKRYGRGSTIVTSNLPFDEWTGVFASERLTGALLDRLTHHVHILEMNGDSYRLKQSKRRQRGTRATTIPDRPPEE